MKTAKNFIPGNIYVDRKDENSTGATYLQFVRANPKTGTLYFKSVQPKTDYLVNDSGLIPFAPSTTFYIPSTITGSIPGGVGVWQRLT